MGSEMCIRDRAKKRNPTGKRIRQDGWLSPLTLQPASRSSDPELHRNGQRASDKGFLNLSIRDYFRLLRWTAKQTVDGMTGKVPKSLAKTLAELGIDASMWRDLVWNWQKYFGKSACVGHPDSMRSDAEQLGKQWHRGQASSAICFA